MTHPLIPRRSFLTLSATALAMPLLTPRLGAAADDANGAADGLTILNEQLAGGSPELMVNRYLMRDVAAAEAKLDSTAAELDSPDKLAAWQERTRGRFVEALGGFPERTPLNAKVTGTVRREGYRVEKILYESRPKHFVTAALFLPDESRFEPPYPGILVPCGHSERPRDRGLYQRPCVMAAMNGMAALIYDPTDQGERMQDVDENGEYRYWGTRGHNRFGVSAVLLGSNAASFLIWDGMRGLDYLADRPEVDADRLGCMGISGGGTLTSFLTALDDRIQAAAPACYISTLREVYAAIGPQDAEQNIHGQLAFGMDHAELLTLAAPRPIRVCATTDDFFPIAGARQSFERTQSVYARLGHARRISFFEDDEGHTWSEPLRIASVSWMNRWLRGVEQMFVPDAEEMGIDAEEIQVTEPAQVMLLPEARSVYDIMREEAEGLRAQREPLDADGLREAVRRRAQIRPLGEIDEPTVVPHGESDESWGTLRKLTFEVRPDLRLPALLFVPSEVSGEGILCVHGEGKSAAVEAAGELAAAGGTVLAVDLTAFGETQGTNRAFYGSDALDESDAVIAYVLERSLTGMRAEDILTCGRWLAGREGIERVKLQAASWAVTPALHAAVAEPGAFASVELADRPKPWREVVATGDRHRYSDVVHGALREYDLDDLEAAVQTGV